MGVNCLEKIYCNEEKSYINDWSDFNRAFFYINIDKSYDESFNTSRRDNS